YLPGMVVPPDPRRCHHLAGHVCQPHRRLAARPFRPYQAAAIAMPTPGPVSREHNLTAPGREACRKRTRVCLIRPTIDLDAIPATIDNVQIAGSIELDGRGTPQEALDLAILGLHALFHIVRIRREKLLRPLR